MPIAPSTFSAMPHHPAPIPPHARDEHRRWLLELTTTPTASGKEHRVLEWVGRWLAQRPDLEASADPYGNLELRIAGLPRADNPVYFTAHMDHPAFVLDRVIAPATVELAFRGGVMDDYFIGARVILHPEPGAPDTPANTAPANPAPVHGTIVARGDATDPFKTWVVDLDRPAPWAAPGQLAVWALPAPSVEPADPFGRPIPGGCLYTHACDDLAALASALAALDHLRALAHQGVPLADPRALLTRAEEIGFVGAIALSRDRLLPAHARVIALETSRSFPHDSPIGQGPIVRVGDRVSTFSPTLTAAVARVAERLAGTATPPVAVEKTQPPAWRWQRKLMAGGACEASVFCAFGYDATCVCLPLGNYHNMAQLDKAQAGTLDSPHAIDREAIALDDFHGMTDLLVACALTGQGQPLGLDPAPSFKDKAQDLYAKLGFVLR